MTAPICCHSQIQIKHIMWDHYIVMYCMAESLCAYDLEVNNNHWIKLPSVECLNCETKNCAWMIGVRSSVKCTFFVFDEEHFIN